MGQTRLFEHVLLTQASPSPTHLVLHWPAAQTVPWLLATNLVAPPAVVCAYRRRMGIEEMLGDFKKHGLDLEMTHLPHGWRLSRLTLAACLLYLWLMALGQHVVVHRLAPQADRTDRRDLSSVRLGWNFLEGCLPLFDPIPTLSMPNFSSVSGR